MPTRVELIDLIREQTLLEEDDLPQAKLVNILNQGMRDLAGRFDWPFLQARTTLNLTAGVQKIAYPANLARLQAITLTGSSKPPLRELSVVQALRRWGEDVPSGTPRYYYEWAPIAGLSGGRDVHLIPIPNETVGGGLTVYYFRTINLLNNQGDSPEFTDQFHQVLVDYGSWKAWERTDDYERGSVHRSLYFEGLDAMARYYLTRLADDPFIYGDGDREARRGHPNMPFIALQE